jgi:hypothetical protein
MAEELDVSNMSDTDAIVHLMTLAKEYGEIAEKARKMAFDIMSKTDVPEFTTKNGLKFRMVSKRNVKVDVDALRQTYPDIYKKICDSGDVSIK